MKDRLYYAEEAVVYLTKAFDLSEEEVVEMIEDKLLSKFGNPLYRHTQELVDDLKSSFDCY